MKMNPNQEAYLKSLVCQRIKDSDVNKELIKHFVNGRNPGIAASLRLGANKDKGDKLAFYIVKDPKLDVPLMFFSLKCGEISVPYDPKRIEEILKNSEMLYNAAKGAEAEDWAKEIIEKMKASGTAQEEIVQEFEDRYLRNLDRRQSFQVENIVEGERIVRVLKSHPAVELVHLCAYDPLNRRFIPSNLPREMERAIQIRMNPVQKRWHEMGMDTQSLAKTLFWRFVVPVVQDVRKLVGCEYLYLFAADRKVDGRLVNYYKSLGFEIREDLTVNKPEYDFCCYFMCQEVTSLRSRRNAFFRSYNPDKT